MGAAHDITGLLAASRGGDAAAGNRLAVLIYDELRRLARSAGGDADTLSTTALVHETYLRLFGNRTANFADRSHFYAYAARAMRALLVDHARRRSASKRGGTLLRTDVDETFASTAASPDQVLALDQTLDRLQMFDPRLARLVELRVFGGLGVDELATALERSPRSIKRDWRRARALLGGWLSASEAGR